MPTPSPRPASAPVSFETLGPLWASFLAPYVIAELRVQGVVPPAPPGEPDTATATTTAPAAPGLLFDAHACLVFANGLGDNVLGRALVMFRLLAAAGQLDSVALLNATPEAKSTPHLASLLTNHLKHRCKSIGLRYPWRSAKRRGRVTWIDFDGIAARMVAAMEHEERSRLVESPADVAPTNSTGTGVETR